jgi:hypothetical protein
MKAARFAYPLTPILLAAALAVALVSTAPTSDARTRQEPGKAVRHAQARYDSPAVGMQSREPCCGGTCSDQTGPGPPEGLGCVVFVTKPGEWFVDVEVQDTLGLSAPAWLQTEMDIHLFCGSTKRPVPVLPGTENFVWVFATSGVGPPCPGTATRGVVEATFLTRR